MTIGLEGVAEIVKCKRFSPGTRVVAMVGPTLHTSTSSLPSGGDLLSSTTPLSLTPHQRLRAGAVALGRRIAQSPKTSWYASNLLLVLHLLDKLATPVALLGLDCYHML